MYCANCGTTMPPNANFCVRCGAQKHTNPTEAAMHRDMATQPMHLAPPMRTYPWRRYCARIFDLSWYGSVILAISLATRFRWLFEISNFGYLVLNSFVVLGLWCAIEAAVLTIFRSTPGKWLCGIGIVHKGSWAPGYGTYFERSVRVLGQGMCLGIPPFALIAMALSHRYLNKNGATRWDQYLGIEVRHRGFSAPRVAVTLALFILVVAAPVLLAKYR